MAGKTTVAPLSIASRRCTLRLGLAAAATFAAPWVRSEPAWPTRPLRWIVPFGPGSGADIVARAYAAALAPVLKEAVVILNRPGSSGVLGAEDAARAAPDGYTLLLASQSTHASNPAMFRQLPYDPVKSFDPVSLLGTFPLICVIHPALPAQNLRELIGWARANPGKLVVAYGTGSAQVTAELFKQLAGAEMLLVPYKSNPLALTAVVSGEAHCMMIDPGPGLPLVASGRVRALAVTTASRSEVAPQLPTMGEAGMPGYELFGWNALMVPAGTPADIIERLRAEVAGAASRSELRGQLRQAGIDARTDTPEQLRSFAAAELAKWTGYIRAAGIVPE